jgi:hypothetical protein
VTCAARNPAVVTVSISSSTISQPGDAAYEQVILKLGIFQSPTSDVSARSSRVSVLLGADIRDRRATLGLSTQLHRQLLDDPGLSPFGGNLQKPSFSGLTGA